MGTRASSRDRVATLYRCSGDADSDCGRRATGAVCFYAELAEVAAFTKDPVVFVIVPVCNRHRAPVTTWAGAHWGHLADGVWIEAAAIPDAQRAMGAGESAVLAETTSDGLRLTASA